MGKGRRMGSERIEKPRGEEDEVKKKKERGTREVEGRRNKRKRVNKEWNKRRKRNERRGEEKAKRGRGKMEDTRGYVWVRTRVARPSASPGYINTQEQIQAGARALPSTQNYPHSI